jgi:hypothetical protein
MDGRKDHCPCTTTPPSPDHAGAVVPDGAALFGASTPAAKALLANLGPGRWPDLLYLGAAFATAPFAFTGGRADLRRDRRNLRLLGGSGLFGGVLGRFSCCPGYARRRRFGFVMAEHWKVRPPRFWLFSFSANTHPLDVAGVRPDGCGQCAVGVAAGFTWPGRACGGGGLLLLGS